MSLMNDLKKIAKMYWVSQKEHSKNFKVKSLGHPVNLTFERTNRYVQRPATLSWVMKEGVQRDW